MQTVLLLIFAYTITGWTDSWNNKEKSMMKQSTGIGILIRNRRKELGMNQAELSKRSTLSQAHVSRIEAGISYPSVVTILKLAKGLQLPPEALIAAAEPHEKAGA